MTNFSKHRKIHDALLIFPPVTKTLRGPEEPLPLAGAEAFSSIGLEDSLPLTSTEEPAICLDLGKQASKALITRIPQSVIGAESKSMQSAATVLQKSIASFVTLMAFMVRQIRVSC